MRPFEGFKRKAVIVVVGDEEQTKRQALQESTDGKGVPDSVILEMKGIYYLIYFNISNIIHQIYTRNTVYFYCLNLQVLI